MNIPNTVKPSSLLNRRFLRALTYTCTVLLVGLVILLFANRQRLIHLDDYVKSDLVPEIFQPQSPWYIVDLSISSCGPFSSKHHVCATPRANVGEYGDVGIEGGWKTLDKDLLLGSSWFTKKFMSTKLISGKYYEANRGNVIVDVAVASPEHCNIKGNRLCIPLRVLEEINDRNIVINSDRKRSPKKRNSLAQEKVQNVYQNFVDMLFRRLSIAQPSESKQKTRIPSSKEILSSGWQSRGFGVWVKMGPAVDNAIEAIDLLFGSDAVEPRFSWELQYEHLLGLGSPKKPLPRLTVKRGSSAPPPKVPNLQFKKNGKFKVLQVADLHFSTGVGVCRDPVPEESAKGCEADPRTLKFLNHVLDLEDPDFIALTGDQIFGEGAPDPQTALFKAVMPFVTRKIPYAITVGNHDDESTLSREEVIRLASTLPYSLTVLGDPRLDGYGNYRVDVKARSRAEDTAALYFMDSHSYSLDPKNDPGYDYFKQSQIDWIVSSAVELGRSQQGKRLSMAFFHIPLPEYRQIDQPLVGLLKEGVTAPRKNTGMRASLARAGVQVASCGHDHANDYCLLDTQNDSTLEENHVWLCYGGGSGEGGYGGYGGYIRRIRTFELDGPSGKIRTWKRLESDPQVVIDEQLVVENAIAVKADAEANVFQ